MATHMFDDYIDHITSSEEAVVDFRKKMFWGLCQFNDGDIYMPSGERFNGEFLPIDMQAYNGEAGLEDMIPPD